MQLKKNLRAFIPPPVTYIRSGEHKSKKDARRLGDEEKANIVFNCASCQRWAVCHDSKKSVMYKCSRYREAVIDGSSIEELLSMENLELEFDRMNSVREEDFNFTAQDEETIEEMIAKVISSNVPVPPDLRIDDREIPLAKNLMEWLFDSRFGQQSQPPFPRQIEIGSRLFGDICPRCSDMDWLDTMPVDAPIGKIRDKLTFLNYGRCPKCKVTRGELYLAEEIENYYGIIGLAGQRSAKTTSAILWSNYNLHRMLKLPSPQAVFATQDTQVISYTYTALTFNQAVANVWNPYLNALRTLPWFKNYHEFLRRKSNQLGEELFNLGEHLVRYRHRNLILNPSGPNKRTMRGQTRMEGLVDEPGWYIMNLKSGKGDPERLDANGVFTALNNSLMTLKNAHRRKIEEGYYDLPKPLMFATSSPSSYNDFIMTAYRIYRASREFYAYKYETWNFNPLLKKKDFAEEFRTKPVEAARDYECNPPIGEGLFIPKVAPLAKAFAHGQNKFSTITHKARSSTGVRMTSSEIRLTTNRFPSYGTVLSIDLGLVNNSLSFSIVGLPDDYDSNLLPEDRETLLTPVQVFAVGEIIPHLDTKISLTDFYTKCIIPLIEPFNVLYLISDRWNSAKIGQDLEAEYEVTPIEHKASWEDFENTRDLLYSGNLLLPKTQRTLQENMEVTLDNYPEVFRGMPVDHLQWQFMTVKEQTNVTVIKGDGTDDSFRTVVLGVHAVQDDEIREALLEGRQAQAVVAQPVTSITARMKGQSNGTTVKTGSDGNALSYLGRRR